MTNLIAKKTQHNFKKWTASDNFNFFSNSDQNEIRLFMERIYEKISY